MQLNKKKLLNLHIVDNYSKFLILGFDILIKLFKMTKNKGISNNILDLIGNTPLIKLNKITKDLPGNFYAKYEGFNPGHSMKDRIALHIIEQAEKQGF